MPLSELEQRQLIVAEARRWIGTPYQHAGDIRGVAVDCGMLLIRVFNDTGIAKIDDPRPYPRDWHLHRDEEKYLASVAAHARRVENPKAGDLMLWRYGRTFSHGAIVTEWGARKTVIHAFWAARLVEESDLTLSGPLSDPSRQTAFYSYWNRP